MCIVTVSLKIDEELLFKVREEAVYQTMAFHDFISYLLDEKIKELNEHNINLGAVAS